MVVQEKYIKEKKYIIGGLGLGIKANCPHVGPGGQRRNASYIKCGKKIHLYIECRKNVL